MGAFAARARLVAVPGSAWTYADGNTLLLSRIIRDAVGGDAASVLAFAHRELFDKLGMERPTLEFDAAGTPVGASRMWATPRDWARLGMLYLRDGVVAGERILPAGWPDRSARLTPGSEYAGYGAGFWTNRAATGGARKRRLAGMPREAFTFVQRRWWERCRRPRSGAEPLETTAPDLPGRGPLSKAW